VSKVVLKPKRAFPDEELAPLVKGIEALGFEVEVEAYDNPFVNGRLGVSWWEVVHAHIVEWGTGAAVGAVAGEALKGAAKKIGEVFVDWAKERGKRPGRNPKQPKYTEIYGPDGKVVSRVKVTDPESDPEIRDE
jgi:hypothetical protein